MKVGTVTLDERMQAWAIGELLAADIEPTPEAIDMMLGTLLAARVRLDMTSASMTGAVRAALRWQLRRLERRLARRRDAQLRRAGLIR